MYICIISVVVLRILCVRNSLFIVDTMCVTYCSMYTTYSSGQVNEVCDGVGEYFNAMLGAQLLYKFERPQYADVSPRIY